MEKMNYRDKLGRLAFIAFNRQRAITRKEWEEAVREALAPLRQSVNPCKNGPTG
jgi:hypothetical protein